MNATSGMRAGDAGAGRRGAFGWGVVGPGRIAHRFAEAVTRMDGAHLAAVQGRDAARASAFAASWSRPDAPSVYTALGDLLGDPTVDAIYIATPHAFHAAAIREALAAGKPVLCEKSLAANASEAAELAALAVARDVFLMEALWTRFLPVYADVARWLAEGAIGAVRGIQSSFCFNAPFDPASRLYDPAQAGGAMLDLGVYNLSMTRWVMQQALGACPPVTELIAHGTLAPTGVDQRAAASLVFDGGVVAQLQCGFDGRADNALCILGEHGHIRLSPRFHEATHAVLQVGDAAPVVVERPLAINGFEGEIAEAMRCIAAGRTQSEVMPLADTVAVARWADAIQARIGVRGVIDPGPD